MRSTVNVQLPFRSAMRIRAPQGSSWEHFGNGWLRIIAELNRRHEIDGILIQLPLPPHVDTKQLLEAVLPEKDVDGFHPVNAGRLEAGRPGLVPCTPAGIIEVLRRADVEIVGKHAVVVGRSNIVGKPTAIMLLNATPSQS